MKINDFDPVLSPLQPGVSLIEASAGTGKTYTIAMLVVRMIVELDIAIDKILVVTFTKAATEELKERIRSRLAEVKEQCTGHKQSENQLASHWLTKLNLTNETIKKRLDMALLDIDRAGIFTIHGFCQRVLSEHALASGQLFDADLTDDLAAIQQACADDFWRREIQARSVWEAAVLTQDFKTPEDLLSSIVNIHSGAHIYPVDDDLANALNNLRDSALAAVNLIEVAKQALAPYLESNYFKTDYRDNFLDNSTQLSDWLTGNTLQIPAAEVLAMFSRQGLTAGLNGTKFIKNKTQTSEERKNEFLALLNIRFDVFDQLSLAARHISIVLRRKLASELRLALKQQLERMNVWTFDSLITQLAEALQGKQGRELSAELRQRFCVALIDEFQDTDNDQWFIFSTVFAKPSHYLMLVGDPKQAIYKFRGADIYSYLSAQHHAQHRYTLTNNWRSHPLLVNGVNRLFGKDNVFLLSEIGFAASIPALAGTDGALYKQNRALAPIEIWQLPENDDHKEGYWHSGKAFEVIKTATVNEILSLLTGGFNLNLQGNNRKVAPQDIAILVRSNQQARDYQYALKSAGIPSVLTSIESVFNTEEARQLYFLLDAILHSGDVNKLTQALVLDWFGNDGQALYQLVNDEVQLGGYSARLADYYRLWQQKGVIAMMQALLQHEGMVNNIAKTVLAERRLTNIHHLLELLQEAALDEHLSEQKTLTWLKDAMTNAKASAENQQIRLESDADAVKIVTMHRAKGLEYPIVFCPCLWQLNSSTKSKNTLVQCHQLNEVGDYDLIADLGSADFERHQKKAQFEQKAEEVRLAYVAITRAKYRCYLAWGNVRSNDNENTSALSWLLDLGQHDFAGQQTAFNSLITDFPESFSYRLLENTKELIGYYQPASTVSALQAEQRHRPLLTDWQMSSYTALSSLSISETPDLPQDKADEQQSYIAQTNEALPSGAHTGNVIHELLEHISFNAIAQERDFSVLISQTCQRYGLRLTKSEIIRELLLKIVSTPLAMADNQFCLMNLADNRCLKEMPFYLSLTSVNTSEVNRILQSESACQPLSYKQISGYLTGFIDLICEYNGRFYVMDYKTNSLPDFRPETLLDAMREHNYGLQYWIYCVVLHQYLQTRLKNYVFEQHFGGVRYLFVRGMQPELPMSAVFADKPDLAKLTSLSRLFKGSHAE